MKINNITKAQNFGMPIAPDTHLGNMKEDYREMYAGLNEYSSDEFIQHVLGMHDQLEEIDSLSKNYIVGIYPQQEKPSKNIPKAVFYAYPINDKKNAIKIDMPELNYPFLKSQDLEKIAQYVKLIESFNIK